MCSILDQRLIIQVKPNKCWKTYLGLHQFLIFARVYVKKKNGIIEYIKCMHLSHISTYSPIPSLLSSQWLTIAIYIFKEFLYNCFLELYYTLESFKSAKFNVLSPPSPFWMLVQENHHSFLFVVVLRVCTTNVRFWLIVYAFFKLKGCYRFHYFKFNLVQNSQYWIDTWYTVLMIKATSDLLVLLHSFQ